MARRVWIPANVVSVRKIAPELNVTPLIDILLVLLIIFMTTVSLAREGLDVHLPEVEPRLRDVFSTRDNRTLFVRGDGSLRYREIIRVIDAAHGAGVTRVGVVTEGAAAGTR